MIPNLRPSLADLALGVAYFLAATGAVLLTRYDGGVAFLWIASALLIAVLMVRPRRLWGGPFLTCAIGSILATGMFGTGWPMAVPFAIINMVEAFVAARLFRQFGNSRTPLGSAKWMWNFIISAGLAGPAAGSSIVAVVLGLQGWPPVLTFTQYFVGHALGNLAFIPLITLVVTRRLGVSLRIGSEGRRLEPALLLTIMALTVVAVFANSSSPLLFLPLLPIMLVTFRLGIGAAALSIVMLALIGGGFTLAGEGPIQMMDAELGVKMQFFQLYLAATVLIVLPVAADLHNQSRLHRELLLSEERYRLMAEHSTDILLHLENDGRIRYISPSVRQLGGYDPDLLVGKNAGALIARDHMKRVRDAHEHTIAMHGQTCGFEYQAMTSDGKKRWFETHSRAVVDEDGKIDGVLSIVRDISARKAAEQQLSVAAMTDPLTGLANRRAFRAAIDQALAKSNTLNSDCLALFDIDHFKRVNDDFGHGAGDDVIRAFAGVARRMVRRADIVARLGGEEFAIHFPETSIEQAAYICDRIRIEMAETATFCGDAAIHVTISGGVAAIGRGGLDPALRAADDALYRSKRNGRDRLSLAAQGSGKVEADAKPFIATGVRQDLVA